MTDKPQTGRDHVIVWLFGILPLLLVLALGLIGLLRRL